MIVFTTEPKTKPPWVNFYNVLQAAFMLADPESAKKTVKFLVFSLLLGSARAKAAHIMLTWSPS